MQWRTFVTYHIPGIKSAAAPYIISMSPLGDLLRSPQKEHGYDGCYPSFYRLKFHFVARIAVASGLTVSPVSHQALV